jgi:outer membrane protein TolC
MTRRRYQYPAIQLLIVVILLMLAGGAFAQTLSLDDYLHQVTEQHDGYKSAAQGTRGAKLASQEASLLFKPNLVGNASLSAIGQNDPITATDIFETRTYNLGIAETTGFGLTGKLSYNRTDLSIPGFSPSSYSAQWAQIDLTQSLWRNWNGREIRAQSETTEANDLAQEFNQGYVMKTILAQAESAYWSLALARELVKIQKDAVDRAQRLADWEAKRTRQNLVDRAEYLSASSTLESHKLDLRTAQDDESTSALAFNSARGINSNVVTEKLHDLTTDLTDSLKIPTQMQPRDDVRAAEMQAKAGVAGANMAREKNKPTFELFATLPLNEPTPPSGLLAAFLASSQPSTTVGVRLNAPLDIGTTDSVRQGYAAQASAAQTNYQRKVFEEDRDWSDLNSKFSQAKARLKLYVDLEQAQHDKLYYERDREIQGRTTLEQVLLYETDYQQAQLGRVRTLNDLLNLYAQLKLYGASNESR